MARGVERNKRNERQQGWEMCGDVTQKTWQQLGRIEGWVHEHTKPHLNLELHSKNNLCMNWVSKGTWGMESNRKEKRTLHEHQGSKEMGQMGSNKKEKWALHIIEHQKKWEATMRRNEWWGSTLRMMNKWMDYIIWMID